MAAVVVRSNAVTTFTGSCRYRQEQGHPDPLKSKPLTVAALFVPAAAELKVAVALL
jgi:hypothetical protein